MRCRPSGLQAQVGTMVWDVMFSSQAVRPAGTIENFCYICPVNLNVHCAVGLAEFIRHIELEALVLFGKMSGKL
jgi:hypothetical protein